MPCLDIVIVNWNAGALLRQCLASVFASDLGEVTLSRMVVVDNASTDGSLDTLPFASPPFTPIRLPANRGFGAACNIGAADSTADYLLFLNPDTVLDRDTLKDAVAFMEAKTNDRVAVSTIRLRDPSGKTQRCCARFPTVGRMVAQSIGLDRLLPKVFPPHFLTDWDHEDTRAVPQVMGAFLLIRRSVFARLSGFDERFFVYYEDVDLCRRIALGGDLCVHNAAVSAIHVGCGTTNQIKARRQFYSARSRIQYAQKYFGRLGALALTVDGLLLAPLARMAKSAASGSLTGMTDAINGAGMLWSDLPNIFGSDMSSSSPGLTRGSMDCRPAGFAGDCRIACEARGPGIDGKERDPVSPRPLSILALTRYPRQGASSRTRFLAYLPALRTAGIEVTVSPFFDDSYLPGLYGGQKPKLGAILGCYWRRLTVLRTARAFDALWVEKEAFPWLPFAAELRLMRGVPFVLDFDDAWFHRYATHRHSLVRALLGTKFEALVRRARLTVVGNDILATWAREAGATEILQQPTPVNLDDALPVSSSSPGLTRGSMDCRVKPGNDGNAGPLRIGWIGTPTTAEAYLRPLLPTLAAMIREGWARLTVIGAGDLPGLDATILPWDEAREVEQLLSFDVGIMPLSDDPWSRGKCAYKLLQYMAVGLPVVASPVGMNCEVVRQGINGFLAENPDDWREALATLAKDPDLRRRMGEAGRAMLAKDYSLSAVTPRLVAALRRAAG
ncbi:MAG TPA: glycosyltransferase [Telmatospirillum sp.]|nr:glycosyltransferase [Telmatospirillum sp.]